MINIDFHSGHIETLCDLKAIAEKHNCKISFGVRSYREDTIDEGLLKQEGFTDDVWRDYQKKVNNLVK